MKKSLFLISTLVFIVACGTTKFITPSEADVRRGQDNFPGLTLQELNEGQSVYMASCSKCHPYKKPGSRTAFEWKKIVPEMTVKANNKLGNTIDAAHEQALLRYVSVMSSASKKK